MHRIKATIILLIISQAVISMSAQVVSGPRNREIISKINAGVYNLPSNGFASFKARVKVDWPVVLGNKASDPEAMKLLNGIGFTVSHDAGSKTVVEHFLEVEPSAAQKQGIEQIFSGAQEALTGFFDTWDVFTVNRLIPVTGNVEISEANGTYVLKWKEGPSDVEAKVGHDFVITETSVTNLDFKSVILPRFVKTQRGLIMSGYSGTYLPKQGPGNTKIDVTIEYQDAGGFSLVKRIYMDTVFDGSAAKLAFDFSEIKVTTK